MASSNTNKYNTGELLATTAFSVLSMHDKGGVYEAWPRAIVQVEKPDNSNERPDDWRYSCTYKPGSTAYFNEGILRRMNLREFSWYRHPATGGRMVGYNESWQFWCTLIGVLCLEYGLHFGGLVDPPWRLICEVFFPSLLALFFFGTYAQYRKWWR